MRLRQLAILLSTSVLAASCCRSLSADTGRLELSIVAPEPPAKGAVVPARVHLLGPDGKAVRAPGLPFWKDHFNCDGRVALDLVPGDYIYTIERGPEYRSAEGSTTVTAGKTTTHRVEIERWIDMKARGWWSGETHIHRPPRDVPLLMRSEDLHIAPVLTVWNRNNSWRDREVPKVLLRKVGADRLYHLLSIEDERGGGAIFFLNATAPIEMGDHGREYPSPLSNLEKALELDAWIDIEKPFWWDVPTWVASGKIDSIGLANNHMCRSTMYADEAWGRPRDAKRLPPPRGNGFHSQEIYYQLLNCGIRIPPSAGSASGVLPNPVGYNRVYVHLDGDLTWDGWWNGLRAGRSFVTNGPMLLVKANGKLPGEVFRSTGDEALSVTLEVSVDGNDPLESVEVIRDGKVVRRIVGGELRRSHRPEPLRFSKSGWFLVRAITKQTRTFRFASTSPFWVEIGARRRTVHRQAVDYFVDWIDQRIVALEANRRGALAEPAKRAAVLAPHRAARRFFTELVKKSR